MLRALHWAHKKDVAKNNKLKEDRLLQKREIEQRALQAQIKAERAEIAYNNWLDDKKFKTARPVTPQECEKRKQSMSNPKTFRLSCASCTPHYSCGQNGPQHAVNIKVSYHQEERNLDSIGKPEKMQPYTNYPPKSIRNVYSAGTNNRSLTSPTQPPSRRGSRRENRSSAPTPSGVQFYDRKLKSSTKRGSNRRASSVPKPLSRPIYSTGKNSTDTLVANLENRTIDGSLNQLQSCSKQDRNICSETDPVANDRANVSDSANDSNSDNSETDSDKLDFNDYDLAYPQFGFDVDDDTTFFHDVGEFNDLDSLSLPAVLTKDKTPAEILQLLQHLGKPEKSYRLRRSNSFSYGNKQFYRQLRRRLSLGSIPEGRIVTDYTEEQEENGQLLRDLEKSINSIGGTEMEESGKSSRSQSPGEDLTVGGNRDEKEASLNPSRCLHLLPPANCSAGEDTLETGVSTILLTNSNKVAPPQTLKIVNLAWDTTSNSVQTHISVTPITTPTKKSPSTNSPLCNTNSLRKMSPPKSVAPPLHVTPPPPDEISPLPHKVTSSCRKLTPPPHEITPLSYITTPPSRMLTPPPHEVTPPLHKATPLSCITTPPPRKLTPPSRKLTPPPHHITIIHESLETPLPSSVNTPSSEHPLRPHSDSRIVCRSTSSPHLLPFHLSTSDPCMVTNHWCMGSNPPHSPKNLLSHVLPSATSANTLFSHSSSTPLFYIGEAEETANFEVAMIIFKL